MQQIKNFKVFFTQNKFHRLFVVCYVIREQKSAKT
jgi:hypothetical protein